MKTGYRGTSKTKEEIQEAKQAVMRAVLSNCSEIDHTAASQATLNAEDREHLKNIWYHFMEAKRLLNAFHPNNKQLKTLGMMVKPFADKACHIFEEFFG